MLRILELEEQYLCGLMNGGTIQDLVLSERNEWIHREIKRLRDLGHVQIPAGVIAGTGRVTARGVTHAWTGYFAGLIREEQKKADIKELLSTVKYGSSGEIIETIREELNRIADEKGKGEIINAARIKNTEYKNTEFIINEMIPVGLTLLMGSPKSGKSWLTLLLAESITLGFPVFGCKTRKSPVLYYTLEDSIRRCKYRLNKIGSLWSADLNFCEQARGTIDIVNGIREVNAKVVFIDTFGAFSDLEDTNSYSETTEKVRELKRIADSMDVAVIVVHHTKKAGGVNKDWLEDALGSQGLVGAADCVIELKRKRGDSEGVLLITGRDIRDKHVDICWDDCVWVKKQ